jgi:hypothetical protein
MKSSFTRAVLAASVTTLVLAAARQASAQALYYDHHSTAYGDYFGGAAEVIRAQGAYNRDTAAAAESWARAVAAQDAIQYQRDEYRYQVAQMELKYHEQKLNQRREEQQNKSAGEAAAAHQLWENVQRGVASWPSGLTRPEYSASMSLVESVLRNWSPDNSPRGDAYRRALATEVGVLRNRVAANKSIDFTSRVEAVRTLDALKVLAMMPGAGAGETGSRLAMR